MSAASLRLLTVVMAVVCGWSLLILVVVETGLGARYSLHPENAEQVAVPPSLRLNRAESALASLDQYAVIAERPLFNTDRRPLPSAATAEAPPPEVAAAPLDVLLTSVIIRGETRIAQFTDRQSGTSQTVKLGESLAGEQSAWRLVELEPRNAVFEGPSGRAVTELRVFDGQGGEAPTAAATPDQAATEGEVVQESTGEAPQSPESRAETIRRRIEERRRQMREEAARAAEKKN